MVEKVLEDASYQVQLKNPSEVQTPEQIDLEIVALDNLMLRIQNRRAEFCRARNQSALISSCLPAELQRFSKRLALLKIKIDITNSTID